MKRFVRLGLLGALLLLAAAAINHPPIHAQAVPQSYGADTQLQTGLIVQLEDNDSTKVEVVSQATIAKMFGVVVSVNNEPVTLSSTTTGPQVYVTTTGTGGVLVSNQNGTIRPGDYITISSLDGVGMKASTTQTQILGKAVNGFDGKSSVINNTSLTDSNGHHLNVAIGQIQVALDIGRNPLLQGAELNLPGFLQKATQAVTDKPVSTARVYIGLLILATSVLIAGSLLYGGVRTSITAIGRNPLSKRSITRSLLQVTLTSLIIFIIGLFAVYLLLKL